MEPVRLSVSPNTCDPTVVVVDGIVVVGARVVVVDGSVVVVVSATVVVVVAGTVVVVSGTVVVVSATVVVVVGGTVVVVVGGTVVVVVGGTVVVVVGGTVVVVVSGTVVVVVGGTVVVVVGIVVVVVGIVVVVGTSHSPGRLTVAVRTTSCGPGLVHLACIVSVTSPVVDAGKVVVPTRVLPAMGWGGAVMSAAIPSTVPAVTATEMTVIVRFVPDTVSEFCASHVTTTVAPFGEHDTVPLRTGWWAYAFVATPTRMPPEMTAVAATERTSLRYPRGTPRA